MSWFDDVFKEYEDRNEAMFAFSRTQVEEQVPWDDFQSGWVALGAGLHVKRDVSKEFIRRLDEAFEADQKTLPAVTVEYIGPTGWMEYPTFKVVEAENDVVPVGTRLVDVQLEEPGTSPELHTISHGEPIAGLRARIVYRESGWWQV